jgi:hypothetical protein
MAENIMLNGERQLTSAHEAELITLLNMACDLYRFPIMPCPQFEDVNTEALLLLAEKNQMSYYFANKLATTYSKELDGNTLSIIRNIIKVNETNFTCMQNALKTLAYSLADYLVIKTFLGFPRVGSDIDILTHDFKRTVETFLEYKFDPIEIKSQKALFSIQGFKIHLHRNVTWANEKLTFIDNELIWANPRTVTLSQVEIKIPNANADFLMHIAHINFEFFCINLPNILYLYNQAKAVDWSILLEQARKHNWERTFKSSIKLLDVLHHTFYPEECPFLEWNLEHRGIPDLKRVSLPMPIPRINMLFAAIEKGLIKWAISNQTLMLTRMLLFKAK